jgi:D-serine dehydratase
MSIPNGTNTPRTLRTKGHGSAQGVSLGSHDATGWRLGGDELVPPVAVILESALENNLTVMAAYCSDAGVLLAPHAKTTMSPEIIDRQLAHGAWGVTAATVYQVGVFADFDVPRILLANQVTDTAGLSALADIMVTRPELEVILIADSVEGVGLLDHAFADAEIERPVPVLVELGVAERRTGARTIDALVTVAHAVHNSPYLALVGVEAYEGVLAMAPSPVDAIDAYLAGAVDALEVLMQAGLIETEEPIYSAGGSAYFDRVVGSASALNPTVRVVLRSGCYVVHDHGKYHDVSPLDGRSNHHPTLFPALEVWASVVSTPEPGLVVVNAGRRDLSYDDRMPSAVKLLRRGLTDVEAIGPWEASGMNDQHTMFRIDATQSVGAGDLVGIGISHPCTTFDKWKTIMVVDDAYRVIEVVETFF